jgi:hypothetical protein
MGFKERTKAIISLMLGPTILDRFSETVKYIISHIFTKTPMKQEHIERRIGEYNSHVATYTDFYQFFKDHLIELSATKDIQVKTTIHALYNGHVFLTEEFLVNMIVASYIHRYIILMNADILKYVLDLYNKAAGDTIRLTLCNPLLKGNAVTIPGDIIFINIKENEHDPMYEPFNTRSSFTVYNFNISIIGPKNPVSASTIATRPSHWNEYNGVSLPLVRVVKELNGKDVLFEGLCESSGVKSPTTDAGKQVIAAFDHEALEFRKKMDPPYKDPVYGIYSLLHGAEEKGLITSSIDEILPMMREHGVKGAPSQLKQLAMKDRSSSSERGDKRSFRSFVAGSLILFTSSAV